MSKSTAQPLQFTIQVQQTFDIQPVDEHSHAQPLQFTPGTPYQLFNIKPSQKLSQE